MPIKTFRGVIADGGQDTIVLHTNDGSIGYRIVKFQLIPKLPFQDQESVVSIWKVEQSTVATSSPSVDLSDQILLGVGIYKQAAAGSAVSFTDVIIFDQEIFNQDIYITHTDHSGTTVCNYYIELEQVKLNLDENTVATLKDIRNVTAPV